MKYNDLKLTARKTSKRLGRGIASGKGKTAGRGTKGQGARTGSTRRPGFTGGQNPLMQRMPKLPGFTNHRAKAANVFVGELDRFGGKTVDAKILVASGLLASEYQVVKIISGRGSLSKPVTVKLQRASASAVAAIESAGGTFVKVPVSQRPVAKITLKST